MQIEESDFCFIKRKNLAEIQGWKGKLLSRPVKEVLIKVVVQAIPTYMINIFKIPEDLIDEIH